VFVPLTEGKNVKILVADSNNDHITLLTGSLEKGLGAEVGYVSSLESFLEKLNENNYDALLIDYRLFGTTGIRVLKDIREKHEHVALIVLFDQRDESMVENCIEDGADDYVMRTSEYLTVLPVVVKQALGKRALLKREDILLRELASQKKLSFMGRLIQGIGHNINSPLASIMGRAQMFTEREEREQADLLAKKDSMPPEEFERQMKLHEKNLRDLNSINESATRLSLIVKNMTYKGQQEQNQAIQYINLNDLLKEEFSFLDADMFFKHEVIKHYEFAQSLPHIKGVYSDFSQGLMTFVQNALEAMRSAEKKELTIRTGYNGQSISVTIRHTGCSTSGEDAKASHAPTPVTDLVLNNNPQELLKPYGARIASASQPGDTTYTIEIPYNRGES